MARLQSGTRIYGNAIIDTNVSINGTTVATSNSTGALKVAGGIGVVGNIFSSGYITGANANLGNLVIANYFSGTFDSLSGNQPNITNVGTLTALSVYGNAIITGNLTVTGNTTYVNSNIVQIEDHIIELGGGANGGALTLNDNLDRGISAHYYTTSAKTAFFGFANSTLNFTYYVDGTETAGVFSGTQGNYEGLTYISTATTGTAPFVINSTTEVANLTAQFANVANTASTAATVTNSTQSNITALGTLSSLTVNGITNLGAIGNVKIYGGADGYVLKTDGTGNLAWIATATGTGNANISGSNTQVFFNDNVSNTLGTSANFTFNKTSNTLTVDKIVANGSGLTSITGANVTGQVSFANVANNVAGSNVSGQVGNATVAGTVYTASQPNITSVGTLNSVTINGNANVANINSNGIVTITNTTQATGTGTGAFIVDGGASITKDLYVGGNLYVPNIISTSSTTLNVSDPLLYLSASSPYPYGYEIGFYSHFATTGNPPGNGYQHTGLVRNHADNDWYLFSNAAEPEGGTVDLANANLIFDTLKLGGIIASGNANIAGNANVGTSLQVGSGTGGTISGANLVSANYFTGVLTTGLQPNITSVGTLGNISVTNAANVGTLNATLVGSNLIPNTDATYTLGNSTNAWSNIYVDSNLYLGSATLTTSGSDFVVHNGNITANYFVGDGSQLTNINTHALLSGTATFVTSNISNVVPGSTISVVADYSNTTYPGGVFTIAQLGPVSLSMTDVWYTGSATKNAYANYLASSINEQNVNVSFTLANATFNIQSSDYILIGSSNITGTKLTSLNITGTGGTYVIPSSNVGDSVETASTSTVSAHLTTNRGVYSATGTTLVATQPVAFTVNSITGSFPSSSVPYFSLNQTFNWSVNVTGTTSAGNLTFSGGSVSTTSLSSSGGTSGTSISVDSTATYTITTSDYFGAGLYGYGSRTIPSTVNGTVNAATKYYPLFWKINSSSSNPNFTTSDTYLTHNYVTGDGATTSSTVSQYLWLAIPGSSSHTFAYTFLGSPVGQLPAVTFTGQTISGYTYNVYGFTNFSAATLLYTVT